MPTQYEKSMDELELTSGLASVSAGSAWNDLSHLQSTCHM